MIIKVNRAPVMTLWAAVVAERLGFDVDEALTIGQAVAGLNAFSKGLRLGIYTPEPGSLKEQRRRLEPRNVLHVDVLHRAVPIVQTDHGLRAISRDKQVSPASVRRYLASKFGEALPEVKAAMEELAGSLSHEDLVHRAYDLYEHFRPVVPAGVRGWGAPGRPRGSRLGAPSPRPHTHPGSGVLPASGPESFPANWATLPIP